MKSITFSALLFLAAISFSSFETPSLSSNVSKASGIETFRIHRQGREVSLTWSASGSATMFRVERSEDGEFFDAIYLTDYTGAKTYKYKDGSFFPGTIYYRIVCVNADGSEERSAVEVIKILQRG